MVAGGAGFIGSHLIDALLDCGYRVVCIDNLITGNRANLKEAGENNNFTFTEHDIAEPFNNLTIQQYNNLNFIFHLASPASPVHYQEHPLETALVNSLGTLHLLRLAEQNKARFLYASTSEVYGEPLEHPQKETYWGNVNPNGIRACYDESKRFGEMLTMIYVKKHSVDGRIARIFNTYGPRMQKDDGRVVSNFITEALAGRPLTVYGDGSHTRSFCYVSDMVTGLTKFMFQEGLKGEVINLGNPEEYRVLELAEKVKLMTKTKAKINFGPLPADDPSRRRPDISKAKHLLDWEPAVSVNEGLNRTIAYFQKIK